MAVAMQVGLGMEFTGCSVDKGVGMRLQRTGLALPSCAPVVLRRIGAVATRNLPVRGSLVTSERRGLTTGVRPGVWRRSASVRVRAGKADSDGVRWWEKDGGPNFHDVHSTQEFVEALSNAGDKLVVVEFYASWCGSCRAMYPKLCKLAAEHLDVEFMKVNFEDNKPMCKSLNIKVLPYFHFYRGAEGRLEDFSCSLSKLQKLREAIAQHNTDRCSIGPPVGAGNIFSASSNDKAAAARASS